MAFRDTWHRGLVYFGLAEERYDDDVEPEPEVELEDRYRERPNVRRLQGRRRRDEFDDIFSEDDPGGRATGVLRPVGARNGRSNDVRVHLVVPKSFKLPTLNEELDIDDPSAIPLQVHGALASGMVGVLLETAAH